MKSTYQQKKLVQTHKMDDHNVQAQHEAVGFEREQVIEKILQREHPKNSYECSRKEIYNTVSKAVVPH